MDVTIKDDEIKNMLEDIVFELLHKRKDFLKEIIIEVIEDMALCKAIDEGRTNEFVSKEEIKNLLNR